MAYYRKRYRRRRTTYGRKRTWRRRFKSRARYTNRRQQNIYQFVKHVNLGSITAQTGTSTTSNAFSFKISDIPGWSTDFQNSYDQYRIKAVKICFIPVSNVTNFTSHLDGDARTTFYNRIFTAFDPNDKTATGIDALREYKTAKWSPNNVIHKRFIYPKVLTTIAEGSGSYGIAQTKGSPWISMGSNQTQFYGLKYSISHPQPSADHEIYVVEAKYYVQFKNYL